MADALVLEAGAERLEGSIPSPSISFRELSRGENQKTQFGRSPMRKDKHHSEVFSGVLKPTVHEAEGVVEKTGLSTGTGVMRKSIAATAKLGTSSGLMDRVDAYIEKMRAEKKATCVPSFPVPNPANKDEFLVVVYCSWEEPMAVIKEPEIPVAPLATPTQASAEILPIAPVVAPPTVRPSSVPKVREMEVATLPTM